MSRRGPSPSPDVAGGDVNFESVNNKSRRQASFTSDVSDRSLSTSGNVLISKINSLRSLVNKNSDSISKVLLTSKESADRKGIIESAFRACKEAFVELSVIIVTVLEERTSTVLTSENVKKIVSNALTEVKNNFKNGSNVSDISMAVGDLCVCCS